MKSSYKCIPCFIRQAMDAAEQVVDDEETIKFILQDCLESVSSFDLDQSPPEMGQRIHRIIREKTGDKDPYKSIKDQSIELALSMVDSVRDKIQRSKDPFETAVRFSIAGNILDFALASSYEASNINASFEKALVQPINSKLAKSLNTIIRGAKTVLVLGDNAGETVFDRLLIETFPGNPSVFYAVKGSPVINDATLEDARKSGLDDVAEIIENGSDAPGTLLNQCTESFKSLFSTADVVISKGQANFETLNTTVRQIFFLTQIKCPVIGDSYGYKEGDWLISNTTELSAKITGKES